MIAPVSAIQASSVRMAVVAHNVANLNTEGYRPYDATQVQQPALAGTSVYVHRTAAPTDLVDNLAGLLATRAYTRANVLTLRTHYELTGMVIDLFA